MPIGIGVVSEEDGKLIFQSYQSGHRVTAGTIHPDLPAMIDRHEAEPRVYCGVDPCDIETVEGPDRGLSSLSLSRTLQPTVAADERVGRTVVLEIRVGRAFQFGNDALGEHFGFWGR